MKFQTCLLVLVALLAVNCGTGSPVDQSASPVSPSPTPTIASGTAPASAFTPASAFAPPSPVKPYKANGEGRVINVVWASPTGGPVPGVTSTFDGRCTVPSDYVVTFTMAGEATHLGHFTGEAEHCTQLIWSLQGPAGATYDDGRFTTVAANGDTITGTYTDSEGGIDESGALWFRDKWTITGGTGRFAGATGHGEEGGSTSAGFAAMLAGAPLAMWLEGTIAYSAGNPR